MSGRPDAHPANPGVAAWCGFLLMCLGMFMAILDIQVVATSLPSIRDALAISPEAMSWIQTAYLIAEVIAIPLTGLFTRVPCDGFSQRPSASSRCTTRSAWSSTPSVR